MLPTGDFPAWSFQVKQDAVLGHLRSVLQKVMLETKLRIANKGNEKIDDDKNWLEAVVLQE